MVALTLKASKTFLDPDHWDLDNGNLHAAPISQGDGVPSSEFGVTLQDSQLSPRLGQPFHACIAFGYPAK